MEITWAVGLEATRCPMFSRVTRPTEACLSPPGCSSSHSVSRTQPATKPLAHALSLSFALQIPPDLRTRSGENRREQESAVHQSSTDRNRDLHMLRQRSTAISCRSNGFFLEYYAGGDAPVKKIEPTRFVRRILDETCVSTTAVPSLI
jgi:hypothetical protein